MRKAIPILLVIVGLGFLAGGVYTAARGFDARDEVRAQLLAQNITTPEDAAIPNARVDDAATADAMANIIGVHAKEATGGKTYAEMGRFLAEDGSDTSDEALALKDEEGNPVPNPLRNVAFQASALQTSLHTSHMAFNVADLVVGLGVFIAVVGLVVTGIGVTLGALVNPGLARRFQLAPVTAQIGV
ncbi:MAG TPA: hypothetical protein VFZ96_11030 [Actinomycetota bacterium]|nr:hypothetical protein [Actinomycetota bacterium]